MSPLNKKILCGLTAGEIFSIIKPEGFNYAHSVAVTNAIYKKRIKDLFKLEIIPKKLREHLSFVAEIGTYGPVSSEISSDGTKKYLFRNNEGKLFETVFIPDGRRKTICVSTQSGCRMGCPFCVTASYGFHGNLSAGDIVNQVTSLAEADSVTHIVFMGMGEPLDNTGNVLKAAEILTAEWGKALSPRNITISTVGITSGVRSVLEQTECNLAVSLYSPFPEERKVVIPAEAKYPFTEIIDIMRSFPLKRKRRLSIAYIMISEKNDTDRHLKALISLLSGTGIKINLLPYHMTGNDINAASSTERMMLFRQGLMNSGVPTSIRKTRGADISAACGLLASGLKDMVI